MTPVQTTIPTFTELNNLATRLEQEQKKRKIAVLTDSNAARYCLPLLNPELFHLHQDQIFIVKPGEPSKSFRTLNRVLDHMVNLKLQRGDLLINLGGGVVCDLGGFAASVYQRGIGFIHIPTSLLAMTDAAIGGKTGINFRHYKNYVGTFASAEHIYICESFLNTLPALHLRSGLAEMCKHAIITSDYGQLEKLKDVVCIGETKTFKQLLEHSVRVKLSIVESDPLESGHRKILNFGHTVGHAIEKVFAESRRTITHGDAVACGMILAIRLSQHFAGLPEKKAHFIRQTLLSIFPKIPFRDEDTQLIAQSCAADKKNEGDDILFVLLDQNAKPKAGCPVPRDQIRIELLHYLSL